MNIKRAKVIKNDSVRIEGVQKLEYEANFESVSDEQAQQARIVSCDGECALIEVSCSCGQKFYLKCNYSDMAQVAAG